MIQVEDILVEIEGKDILKNISLSIQEGEVVAILGENGAGKTTLLNAMFGTQRLSSGKVWMDEGLVPDPYEILIPGMKSVGYVTQHLSYDRFLTVRANLKEELKGLTHEAKERITLSIAEECEITHLLDKSIEKLSGGQKQRITLAKSLITPKKVFLFDEPFSHLDPLNKNLMQNKLHELIMKGQTIVLVSHDIDEVMKVADRVIVLKEGEIHQDDSMLTVLKHPKDNYVERLLFDGIQLSNDLWLRLDQLQLTEDSEGEIQVMKSYAIQTNSFKTIFSCNGKRYMFDSELRYEAGKRYKALIKP